MKTADELRKRPVIGSVRRTPQGDAKQDGEGDGPDPGQGGAIKRSLL
jgi:hypothetical protein